MAIFKNGLIRGRVGNVVYKVVNGKSVVASYPRQKRNNFKPSEQHGRFGMAIKISSRMYRQLKEFNLNLVTSDLYNRLTGFFTTTHSMLVFEEKTTDWKMIGQSTDIPVTRKVQPRHLLRESPTMIIENGKCRINVPNFELSFFTSNSYRMPQGIVSLQNAIIIIHYNFESESAEVVYSWESERYNLGVYDKRATVTLEPELLNGVGEPLEDGLLLAAFNIRTFARYGSMAYLNHKNFNPGMIMGIWSRE